MSDFCSDPEVNHRLEQALEANLADANEALARLHDEWPQFCQARARQSHAPRLRVFSPGPHLTPRRQAINTIKATRMVLHGSKRVVENARHHGGIHEAEAERLLDLIDQQACKLNSQPWQKALPEHGGTEHGEPDLADAGAEKSIVRSSSEKATDNNSYWPSNPASRVTTIRVRPSEMTSSMKKDERTGPNLREERVTLRHALSAGWLMGLHRSDRKKRRRANRWTAMQHANKVHPAANYG